METASSTYSMKGKYTLMSSGVIASLMACIAFIWVILVTYRPCWVRFRKDCDDKPKKNAPADPQRAFVWALIITLIIAIIVSLLRKF